MANTYTLISSVTVGAGGASSIDFTSIPATYTDLLIKVSIRSTYASVADNMAISFNGSSSSFAYKILYGTGSSSASYGDVYNTNVITTVGNNATSNTFANGEIYIPNYAGSNYKSISADSVAENNATAANQYLYAGLWSNTSAINRVTLTSGNGANFAQYTTAYLYGIKNS